MTRNQLTTDVQRYSRAVIFTMDGSGGIASTEAQDVNRGDSILTQAVAGSPTPARVCAREDDAGPCQCSMVVGVPSGTHMATGTAYTISASVSVPSEFEIYAITDTGAVANTTNGTIRVKG